METKVKRDYRKKRPPSVGETVAEVPELLDQLVAKLLADGCDRKPAEVLIAAQVTANELVAEGCDMTVARILEAWTRSPTCYHGLIGWMKQIDIDNGIEKGVK